MNTVMNKLPQPQTTEEIPKLSNQLNHGSWPEVVMGNLESIEERVATVRRMGGIATSDMESSNIVGTSPGATAGDKTVKRGIGTDSKVSLYSRHEPINLREWSEYDTSMTSRVDEKPTTVFGREKYEGNAETEVRYEKTRNKKGNSWYESITAKSFNGVDSARIDERRKHGNTTQTRKMEVDDEGNLTITQTTKTRRPNPEFKLLHEPEKTVRTWKADSGSTSDEAKQAWRVARSVVKRTSDQMAADKTTAQRELKRRQGIEAAKRQSAKNQRKRYGQDIINL